MATGWSYYNDGIWVDATNTTYTFEFKYECEVPNYNGWDAPSNEGY